MRDNIPTHLDLLAGVLHALGLTFSMDLVLAGLLDSYL